MPIIPNARLCDDWSSSLLQLIGQVVIAAGQLEYVVNLRYKRLAKQEYSQGMQKVADLFRFPKKTKAIKQAATSRGLAHSDRKQLSKILRRAECAWKDRNGVIHAVYAEIPSGKGLSAINVYRRR